LEIKRAKKVWLSALDEKGEPIELEADDTLAVIFQHEIDHINGIVFTDRVRFFQKIKLRNQLKQLVKK
jgi:peptide deformylase